MKIADISKEMQEMIASLLESIKIDLDNISEKNNHKTKKQIIQMIQQLSSILHKLTNMKLEDNVITDTISEAEDLKIIEDFLKKGMK